ncbi:MAG: hypothetical protein R2813_00310 [Flavobacteriales bacterium]
MFIRFIGLVVSFCLINGAQANSMYLEAIEEHPDEKQLAKSRKTILAYREIEIRDDLDQQLPPFHRRPQQQIGQGETFCQACHLSLPHRHSLWTRALLNMHSRYIACSTCHFRPESVTFTYRWLDFSNGQALEADSSRFRADRDLDNENLPDGNVKIAPFWQDQPAVPLPSSSKAQDIARQWRDSDIEQKIQLHAQLHRPLEPQGLSCDGCHQEQKPLFDLQALGADLDQAKQIQRHVLPQFFKRYQNKEQKIRILDLTR